MANEKHAAILEGSIEERLDQHFKDSEVLTIPGCEGFTSTDEVMNRLSRLRDEVHEFETIIDRTL